MAAKPRKRGARDYAAEYRRRQARAKKLGFTGYYERRTRVRPGAEKPAPAVLARLRGHAARSDFLDYIQPGDLVMLDQLIATIEVDDVGRFRQFDKRVVPSDSKRDERSFTIRNQTRRSLARLIRDELDRGAILTPVPSLDQRRLVGDLA